MHNKEGYEWSGRVFMSFSDAPIELTIEVRSPIKPSSEKIQLIKSFERKWPKIKGKLLEYMAEIFYHMNWEKSPVDLQSMYYLSSVDLKRNNAEWWIVLKPALDIPSVFNFFPRFTLKDDEIIWSNLK